MCGIAGIFNLNQQPVVATHLNRMTHALVHRGPDGNDTFIDGCLGLGHTRLAIIDLSAAAAQPMHSHNQRYVITYNGEIYNYRELRDTLISLGHIFKTDSDTEVLLNAFIEWGSAALNKLNGMFAFAIWDRQEKTLFLARDRYGIKPLYYCVLNNQLLFASEVKALLQHPALNAKLDKEALLEYLTFQNIFTDKTFFQNVKLLPSAHYLQISLRSPALSPHEYWDYQFQEPTQIRSKQDYADELDHLFTQAVKRQLRSDVPIGAYLSGGMDSGSITAVAAKNILNLKSFTVGFDLHSASGMELAFDEREKAEYMSSIFRTEQYEMVLKAGDMERALPLMAQHLETPRVGQSYPNYYAAKLASQFNKVVLSGAGGDESFGGYPWRYYRAVINDDFNHYIDKYYRFWQRLINNTDIKHVLQPIWGEVSQVQTRDIFCNVFKHHADRIHRPEDYINHSLYFEAKTFLHGLLVVEDKLSMAFGLETRLPFLDNDLFDFAMRLPIKYKLGNLDEVVRLNENEPGPKTAKYFERTRDGKLLLREVMQRHIPEKVTSHIKQGFSAPDASWFKGESINYVKKIIMNNNAHIYKYLDPGYTQQLVQEHFDGKQNRRLLIWSLISLENWCNHNLGSQSEKCYSSTTTPGETQCN